uniref:Uncharacterized protein n=1 Tax=Noccaea caerulescens TaxID=107243 RepID=A0A1J3E2G6_NOCCA
MEDWLQANNIPEEEKTSYAEDTLTEDAFRCWEQDAYVRLEYDEPDSSWEEMKQILNKEFVEDAVTNLQYYSRIYANPEPRRWILATRSSPKSKQKRAHRDEPKKVLPSALMEKTEANKPVRTKEVQPVPDHQTVKKKQSSKQLFKPQDKPKQCKSSKISKEVITTCYRCHKRGHYAVVFPTRPVDNSNAQEVKLDSSSDCLVQSNSEISISSMMHLSLPKNFDPGIRQEEGNTSRDTIMLQIANVINMSLSFTQYIPMVLNSDIMHLFLAQSAEIIAGTKGVNFKEVPPDQTRGFTPPDVSSNIKHQLYKGKVLNSKNRVQTNLLSLGAGAIVSRSKPFQEGEYDEDIKSSSTKEVGTRNNEEENMKLRRAKEASELSSAQMEAKIKHPSSTNTFRSDSTHIEFTTKKNQLEMIPDEEDIEDTFCKVFNGRYGDLRSLIESFRPNQKDLSYKSNCSIFSTHQRNTANWTRFNQRSDQGVISFTNRVTRNFTDLDPGALIGVFRPNQKEIGHEPTCY